MPRSTAYFKTETIQYIRDNFSTDIQILDVGAGIGTYSDLLKPLGYLNIDAVEVFEPYIEMFGLAEKYNRIWVNDVTTIQYDFKEWYDLMILGDMLEHIDQVTASAFTRRLTNIDHIIAVPFGGEQGIVYDNQYEIHKILDITPMNFNEKFGDVYSPLCLRFDYGVFVNRPVDTIYIEDKEMPLPQEFMNHLLSLGNKIIKYI